MSKNPVITNEEYVAAGGGICPFCRSTHVSGVSSVSAEARTAWQDITCDDCHHNWQDTYMLEGFTTEFSEQPEETNAALKNYVVLYRTPDMAPLDAPLGFQCWAEDTDHAEEQCESAYPDCDILWVWQGAEGAGVQPALDDYYGSGG